MQDKYKLKEAFKLNALKEMKETDPTDEMIAANFGYACDIGINVEMLDASDKEVIGDSISKN